MDSPLAAFTELVGHSSNKEWRWIDDESLDFSKREKNIFRGFQPTTQNLLFMDSPLAVFTELAWHSSNKEWRWIDDESQVFSKREKRFLEVTPTYVNLGKQSKSCTKTLQTVKGLTLH